MANLPIYEDVVESKTRKALVTDENIQVLFNTDTIGADRIEPWPSRPKDVWNHEYVRLPYSTRNTMKIPRSKGNYF